jgi:hypothetical protein
LSFLLFATLLVSLAMPALAQEGTTENKPPDPGAGREIIYHADQPALDLLEPAANLLTESFDGVTFPPTGWTSQNGNCTWSRVTSGTNPTQTPHSGAGEAMLNSFSSPCTSGNTRQLVTMSLNFSAAGSYQISFWMYHDNGYSTTNDRIQVQVSVSTIGGLYTNVGTAISRYSATNGWTQHTVDLSTFAGQATVFVALQGISAFGNNMFVDDVSVDSAPPAPPNCATSFSPANLATNVAVTANLTWASGGGAPTGYKIFFGTDNPPTNIANGTNLGLVTTYDPPGNMAYSTLHYWKIVPYNDNGDATGCTVISFTTQADPTVTTFPYTQNFDGVTAPALPNGWSVVNGATSNSIQWANTSTGSARSAPNAMFISYDLSNAMDDWFFSPPLQLTGGTPYQVDFYYRAVAASYTEKLEVKWGYCAHSGRHDWRADLQQRWIHQCDLCPGQRQLDPFQHRHLLYWVARLQHSQSGRHLRG